MKCHQRKTKEGQIARLRRKLRRVYNHLIWLTDKRRKLTRKSFRRTKKWAKESDKLAIKLIKIY